MRAGVGMYSSSMALNDTRAHTQYHTHTHQEPSNKIAKHGGAKPGVHWSATPLQMNIIFRLDPKDLAPSSNARL